MQTFFKELSQLLSTVHKACKPESGTPIARMAKGIKDEKTRLEQETEAEAEAEAAVVISGWIAGQDTKTLNYTLEQALSYVSTMWGACDKLLQTLQKKENKESLAKQRMIVKLDSTQCKTTVDADGKGVNALNDLIIMLSLLSGTEEAAIAENSLFADSELEQKLKPQKKDKGFTATQDVYVDIIPLLQRGLKETTFGKGHLREIIATFKKITTNTKLINADNIKKIADKIIKADKAKADKAKADEAEPSIYDHLKTFATARNMAGCLSITALTKVYGLHKQTMRLSGDFGVLLGKTLEKAREAGEAKVSGEESTPTQPEDNKKKLCTAYEIEAYKIEFFGDTQDFFDIMRQLKLLVEQLVSLHEWLLKKYHPTIEVAEAPKVVLPAPVPAATPTAEAAEAAEAVEEEEEAAAAKAAEAAEAAVEDKQPPITSPSNKSNNHLIGFSVFLGGTIASIVTMAIFAILYIVNNSAASEIFAVKNDDFIKNVVFTIAFALILLLLLPIASICVHKNRREIASQAQTVNDKLLLSSITVGATSSSIAFMIAFSIAFTIIHRSNDNVLNLLKERNNAIQLTIYVAAFLILIIVLAISSLSTYNEKRAVNSKLNYSSTDHRSLEVAKSS